MSASSHRSRNFAIAIGTLALVGFIAVPLAAANGNSGIVKVHDPADNGKMRNDPHVGCSFFVEGFGMDADSGTITIRVWQPTSDTGNVVLSANWSADGTADSQGDHHFLEGPFSLPSGHYKVFVSDSDGHTKTKVFWVDCSGSTPPPCTENCVPPNCTENCVPTNCTQNCGTTPPTTQVPFFPSAGALALGLAGAAGSIGVAVLRRR